MIHLIAMIFQTICIAVFAVRISQLQQDLTRLRARFDKHQELAKAHSESVFQAINKHQESIITLYKWQKDAVTMVFNPPPLPNLPDHVALITTVPFESIIIEATNKS